MLILPGLIDAMCTYACLAASIKKTSFLAAVLLSLVVLPHSWRCLTPIPPFGHSRKLAKHPISSRSPGTL